jgi:hypothetical protein
VRQALGEGLGVTPRHSWQLGALEWVFPKIPTREPVPGARYGTFGAACHWHGPLVTLHIWLWYPNPSGLFSGTNPLATIYNKG